MKELNLAMQEKQSGKRNSSKLSETEKVTEYMQKLQHPLKNEIEIVRTIIKGVDARISERIKWNAPSYYYKDDIVTFNHRATHHVHLVFHHPSIVNIESHLLIGNYKDRRMMHFSNMQEVKTDAKELEAIMKQLINFIDNN